MWNYHWKVVYKAVLESDVCLLSRNVQPREEYNLRQGPVSGYVPTLRLALPVYTSVRGTLIKSYKKKLKGAGMAYQKVCKQVGNDSTKAKINRQLEQRVQQKK